MQNSTGIDGTLRVCPFFFHSHCQSVPCRNGNTHTQRSHGYYHSTRRPCVTTLIQPTKETRKLPTFLSHIYFVLFNPSLFNRNKALESLIFLNLSSSYNKYFQKTFFCVNLMLVFTSDRVEVVISRAERYDLVKIKSRSRKQNFQFMIPSLMVQ